MSQNIETQPETEQLIDDAQALLSATSHTAENKVREARERLASALEKARAAWGTVQDKAVAGAKVTDKAIRENPYKAIGIAAGVGALVGFLWARRSK
jgi:ElaB/YqjD/DUF883 family membrane-anchored ribosome-binding protein